MTARAPLAVHELGRGPAGEAGTPAAELVHHGKGFRGALRFGVLLVAVFAAGYGEDAAAAHVSHVPVCWARFARAHVRGPA